MPSLSFYWTLPLLAKPHRPKARTSAQGFIAEFDCRVSFHYWGDADAEYGWELESVEIDGSGNEPGFYITPSSDPELWPIILRGYEDNAPQLAEMILELIRDDESNAKYERAAE